MSSKKSDDKLSKLMSFGTSAGSKPAAAAVSQLAKSSIPDAPEVPKVAENVVEEPVISEKSEVSAVKSRAGETDKKAPKPQILIRNVGFTEEDLLHLDRLTQLLRDAGEFRPSISDVVRVALRGCQKLTTSDAKRILESTRKLDGRRKR